MVDIYNNATVHFAETNAISCVKIIMLIAWSVSSKRAAVPAHGSDMKPHLKVILYVSDHQGLTNSGWHAEEIISANYDYLVCVCVCWAGGWHVYCYVVWLHTHWVKWPVLCVCVWLMDGLMIVHAMSHRGNQSYDCPTEWMNHWMKYWTTAYIWIWVCHVVL